MHETTVTIEDAAACLEELVQRVHTGHVPIVISKSGLPMVRIVPMPNSSTGLIAFLARWRSEHPEPDEEFATAIEESRSAIQPPQNPWE